MTMDSINGNDWFPNLAAAIDSGDVKTFPTKDTALDAAMRYGWGKHVVRVEKRFERVWIVGTVDFQPDTEKDIEFQSLRIPLLRYDTGNDGIKYQPVVKFRRPYPEH